MSIFPASHDMEEWNQEVRNISADYWTREFNLTKKEHKENDLLDRLKKSIS
jgi:hypothetical protein